MGLRLKICPRPLARCGWVIMPQGVTDGSLCKNSRQGFEISSAEKKITRGFINVLMYVLYVVIFNGSASIP
jgi:hypothetical protein